MPLDFIKNKAEKTVESIENTCDQSVTAVASVGQALNPANLKDFTHRKIAEMVNDFTGNLPLFERAGFLLKGFAVDISISPKLAPRFVITRIPSEEEQQALLKEAAGCGISQMVLSSLFKAVSLQQYLKVGDTQLCGLEVHLGTMPTVRLLFGDQLYL